MIDLVFELDSLKDIRYKKVGSFQNKYIFETYHHTMFQNNKELLKEKFL